MAESEQEESRHAMARRVAFELLQELEDGKRSVADCLLKGKRLALLLHDADAQTWLDLELRGYPQQFLFDRLGQCRKFAEQGGRLVENRYHLQSLPEIEARMRSAELRLSGLRFPSSISPSVSSANPYEAAGIGASGAAREVLNAFNIQTYAVENALVTNTKLYHSLRSSVHNYATDVYLTLAMGDLVEGIFEQARTSVHTFVRDNCPRAIEQLLAVDERMREGDVEARAQALVSCRRMLKAVADAVFPARTETHIDRAGRPRAVGPEEYKNRLLAFFDLRSPSGSTGDLDASLVEHLASRLDAVNDKLCKGVHADVAQEEALLAVIHMYLIIAEVAKLQVLPQS